MVGIGSNINVVDLNDFTSSESSSSPKVREELNCSIRNTVLTASGMVHYYDSRRLHGYYFVSDIINLASKEIYEVITDLSLIKNIYLIVTFGCLCFMLDFNL